MGNSRHLNLHKGSVVTFFDDQEFPTGQNSLMVTKTVAGPIEVPIAENFLSGEQHNGTYFSSRPGYNWVLSKHVLEHPWLDIIRNGFEFMVAVLNSDNTDDTTVSGTQGDVVNGFLPKGSGDKSDNNHVDNLSSIRFGGEPILDTSSVVARLLDHH